MDRTYLTPNQVAKMLMVSPTAVRQWAEKGELSALTTPGGHRRFLPSEVERFTRKRDMVRGSGKRRERRILIIDDDEQFSRYLKHLLEERHASADVEACSDGFSAGFKVREFEPDIILLDLMMPGMSGVEVCRLLKSNSESRSIRVIGMTGCATEESMQIMLNAGAEACFSKPLDTKKLFECLGGNNLLQNKL